MQADLLIGSWWQTWRRPQYGQDTSGIRRGQQINLLGGTPQVDEVHPATVVGSGRTREVCPDECDGHPDPVQIALWRFARVWIAESDADFTTLGR